MEVKLEAVRLADEESKTRMEIAELFWIVDPGGAKIWLWQYRQEGQAAFHQKH
jgi:hypothetical protein